MKTILLFTAVLVISGCSTPFHEYESYNKTPTVIERSVNPLPAPPKVESMTEKTDEEKGIQTFKIDLIRE